MGFQDAHFQLAPFRLMPALGNGVRLQTLFQGLLHLLGPIGVEEAAKRKPFASAELEKVADVLGRKGVQGPTLAVF
jgi:hypothetical protein